MTNADLFGPDGALRFPRGFLFGSSTAGHQIEGNNTNTDWWVFEHEEGTPVHEPSGDANDSYHRYREDVELVRSFGLNSYRFSLEWSRIEPAEGFFSRAELAHYRRIIQACHDAGLTPVVTFSHFTIPRWLYEKGGYINDRFPELFERYCDRAAAALGDLIGWACTINEPEGPGDTGWVLGVHPPGIRGDREGADRVTENLLEAHRRGAAAIRRHSEAPVGVTLAFQDMQYEDGATPGNTPWEENARVSERFLLASEDDEFVGIQTYTRIVHGPEGQRGPGLQPEKKNDQAETETTTMVGWEIYPQALRGTIKRAAELTNGKPILLTENGIATEVDQKRVHYIDGALRAVHAALAEGYDVRGYLYWSLLDNYEWSAGFLPKFGLAAVDRETFERHPKPSGYWLGAVAQSGELRGEPVPWPPRKD